MKNFIIINYLIVFIIITASLSLFAQEKGKEVSKSNLKIFIQYKLAKANLLKNENINVEINGNNITLAGTVSTLYDKNEAAHEARSVDENYSVINDLKVNSAVVSDSTLKKEIKNKIRSNVFYGVFDWLTVGCNDGTVTLTGWVHWPWLKNQYESEVDKIAGVTKVINNIQNTFGPGEMGFKAAKLIYNDPSFWGLQYSSNPPIHIIVNNGSILLFGKVSTNVEKSLAETLISFNTDAVNVEDNLKVIK